MKAKAQTVFFGDIFNEAIVALACEGKCRQKIEYATPEALIADGWLVD